MKRLFDVVVALIVLGITAPLLVIIAVLITLELRRPPPYLSKRVGSRKMMADWMTACA